MTIPARAIFPFAQGRAQAYERSNSGFNSLEHFADPKIINAYVRTTPCHCSTQAVGLTFLFLISHFQTKKMDGLDSKQRQALLQLRELTDGADDEVSISMLSIVDWDVQVNTTNLFFFYKFF